VEPAAFAATQASPGFAPPPASIPRAPALPISDEGEPPVRALEEIAAAAMGAPQAASLSAPTLAALNECLGTLMEGAPTLETAPRVALADFTRPQGCRLLNDEGVECGALVLDLRAAVLLGAALLAVPRDEALRQIEQDEPSEDTLLAMSEICNNLTAPINAASGNRHVRATALSSLDVATLPAARERADFAVDGGALVLLLF
jgi:hypothetical protein